MTDDELCACRGFRLRNRDDTLGEGGDGRCPCGAYVSLLYVHAWRACHAELAEHGDEDGRHTTCQDWMEGLVVDAVDRDLGARLQARRRHGENQAGLEAWT